MSLILLERREAIAIVRLNRPEKRNALSRTMLEELRIAFEQFENEQNLTTVILTGSGDAFCAGTDIAELADLDQDEALATSERGQSVCNQIENCSVPVIGAINGIAAGGGCELALACHLRIVSLDARFTLPETLLGVIPAYGGTHRLPREIGYSRALEVMLTGGEITAKRAFELGLVNRIADGDVLVAAELLARDMSKLAPLAIRGCLKAVVRGLELSLAEGLAIESEIFASLFGTQDVREGTRAFLEKRAPVFKGR
ncbi:MAG TPA: enoyl-CoA hydratase/isomerase family protein [Pyrinomonadaceae bacterium]|nr:enoyl-CoA hydratase/isomerase family protein [Pyrinomonadaceae bacterium]